MGITTTPPSTTLAKKFTAALNVYLGHLPEHGDAARRYITDGTGEEVLLQLAGLTDATKALGLFHDWQDKEKNYERGTAERAVLFNEGKGCPPAVWVRFGQVLEAAGRSTGPKTTPRPGWPAWLERLVGDMIAVWCTTHRPDNERQQWALADIEAILTAGELPTDLFARTICDAQAQRSLGISGNYHHGDPFSAFTGWDDYLNRHAATVREVLTRPNATGQMVAVQTLARLGFDFTPLVDVLVQVGTGTQKTAREAVLPLLLSSRDLARPLIDQLLAEGDAARRHEAVLLLWRLDGAAAADRLRQQAEWESSERVRQTIEKLLAAPIEQAADEGRPVHFDLPPVRMELGVVPLPQDAVAGLRECFQRGYQEALRHHEQMIERFQSQGQTQYIKNYSRPEAVSDKQFQALVAFVEGRTAEIGKEHLYHRYLLNKPFGDWFTPPGAQLIHVVRLAFACNWLRIDQGHRSGLQWFNTHHLDAYRGRCPQPFDLRELDTAAATLPGSKPGRVVAAWLANNSRYNSFCDWEPDALWPAFAENHDILREVLTAVQDLSGGYRTKDYALPEKRRNAFRVLAMFPQLPPGFVPLLWDVALGDSKSDRLLAQAALGSVPDKAAKILVALKDGRQTIRASAAEWLGKIGDPAATDALKEAFRKEKQEFVKGTLITALEQIGADVREFLDRDALLKEAEQGLAKKRSSALAWLPLDTLPTLYWEDTGKKVAQAIVQWWVLQCVQQKAVVPDPLLRRYLAMCRKIDVQALAKFALSSWIGHDTALPSAQQAAELARAETDRRWARWGQQKYYLDHYKNDKENLYREMFTTFANQFLGSAIGQKGMLALVAAGGDADCVKLCENYIRKWFGNRLAQCKCLVEVLAWLDHPLAIQVLLALGSRFRTKVIRKMAAEHVAALAERQGWTVDELADRTIPDAGFARAVGTDGAPIGTEGILVLDYGPRQFTVKLNDELEPTITTADGKTLKNLPAIGKSDDAEQAKAARKAFTEAKKVVKEVVKRQSERLYEALCTQRSWPFAEWRQYLAAHPIAGRLCVHLTWAAFDANADRFLGCFRPLEDGSLTNEKDEEVTFEPDVHVRLAHACNTPAEVGTAWEQHFTDYDVEPLFQQFGRATYTLPAGKEKETDIKDFEGHGLTTFKLRGRATKLGYVRGEAEDGGCFYLYRKPFPSLGLQAVIGFTGSCLPEQDVPAALTELYVTQMKGEREAESSWNPSKLELGKVPPVLLSECYNDVKQIAADGSGFDPKWQEKSYF